MAHQCLKCGRSYPDGSPQILKGCEECQGTRFFYTEKPIGEREREELQARTEDELGSAGQELPRRERRIPTKGELPVGDERDWVSMGPGNLRNIVEDVVRRAHEKKPTFRVAAGGERPPSLEEWVRQRQKEDEPEGEGPADNDLRGAEDEVQESPWPPWPGQHGSRERGKDRENGPGIDRVPSAPMTDDTPAGQQAEEKADVVYRRRRQEPALPLEPQPGPQPEQEPEPGTGREPSSPSQDRAPGPGVEDLGEGDGLDKEGDPDEPSSSLPQGRPETVEVLEQGVYDLDVERLLEKNPIVVHKDGSYSLHLPSLMETLEKKRR